VVRQRLEPLDLRRRELLLDGQYEPVMTAFVYICDCEVRNFRKATTASRWAASLAPLAQPALPVSTISPLPGDGA